MDIPAQVSVNTAMEEAMEIPAQEQMDKLEVTEVTGMKSIRRFLFYLTVLHMLE